MRWLKPRNLNPVFLAGVSGRNLVPTGFPGISMSMCLSVLVSKDMKDTLNRYLGVRKLKNLGRHIPTCPLLTDRLLRYYNCCIKVN
jgi:hypothetical protein